MPTYEYACKSCGEHTEVVQSFTDAPLRECPTCGGELRKVFHAIGISFKGDGFYRTDSRKSTTASTSAKSGGDGGGSGSGDAGSGGGGDGGKSDTASSPSKAADTTNQPAAS